MMADSGVQLYPDGGGKTIDTRTEATNGQHRQVIVVGDPSTNAGVAPVDVSLGLRVNEARGATSTLSNVAGSASSVMLLAANTGRIRATIVNDGAAVLYVKEGTTASSSSYSWRVEPFATLVIDDYNGRLDGIWATATGNARVTEVTV